jgi:hypothetical protein
LFLPAQDQRFRSGVGSAATRTRSRIVDIGVKDSTLLSDLEALVEPTSRGDPEQPLRWTCKSLRKLARELEVQGHQVSRTLVGELLESLDYSLQGNRKTKEGLSHPDRDAQFRYINETVSAAMAEQQNWSAISRTPAASGGRKALRKRSWWMTS